MNLILKCILVVMLMCASSQAANKANILDANVTTYVHMLTTLSNKKHSNDQTQLQILLLKTLIRFKEPKKTETQKIYTILSSKQYGDLFAKYLNVLQDKITDEIKIQTLSSKLSVLKDQMSHAKDKKNKLLTLQLQYAYYSKFLKSYKIQILNSKQLLSNIKHSLNSSIGKFVFNIHDIQMHSNALHKKLSQIDHNIQQLEILKQKYELLGYKHYIHPIKMDILQNQKYYNAYLKQLIVNQFLNFSYLLSKKNHKAVMIQDKIIDDLKSFKHHDEIIATVKTMLKQIQTKHFGGLDYTLSFAMQEIKLAMKYAWSFAAYPIFTINGTGISLFKFVMAIIIFILGFIVGGKYKRKLKHVVFAKMDISIYARTIMANLGYYIIIIITFFVSLNIMGISLSSLALVAGALSVGIGFGLQNIVSNFVSGIILMFEKSIKVDDYVELADGLHGKIVDIRMRSTTLNTNDNIDITIPNQTFIQGNVINWTLNDDIRRFEIPFDVNYGQKPEFIIKIILEAVEKSGFKDVVTTSTNFSRVIMTSLGDSTVNFSLFVWIKGEEIRHPKRTMSRFLILIYNTCYDNNVEISFPQRDLHIRSIDEGVSFPINLIKQPD